MSPPNLQLRAPVRTFNPSNSRINTQTIGRSAPDDAAQFRLLDRISGFSPDPVVPWLGVISAADLPQEIRTAV